MTTTQQTLPMILDEVEVVRVDRISPSFVRVELGGACLAEFGVDGPLYDQRIKLVFPGVPGGPAPSFEGADDSWYDTWLRRPVEERGHMRTYTIRDVRGAGEDTRLVVDIVVHPDDHGAPRPGCAWAASAAVGDLRDPRPAASRRRGCGLPRGAHRGGRADGGAPGGGPGRLAGSRRGH